MRNEVILIVSLVVLYGAVLFWYRLFGRAGMYGFTVFATIAANIEVMLLVDAFGMEMTLGNILFATTFLVTDILSETEGKAAAQKAVYVGIATSVLTRDLVSVLAAISGQCKRSGLSGVCAGLFQYPADDDCLPGRVCDRPDF